jgi:hypothetical protein
MFRIEALTLRFLDAVSHLSEVSLSLDEHMCVDESWPSFQAKDFATLPRRRQTAADEQSISMSHCSLPIIVPSEAAPSSDGGRSMPADNVLSGELERLRAEKSLLMKERDDAVKYVNYDSDVCCAE